MPQERLHSHLPQLVPTLVNLLGNVRRQAAQLLQSICLPSADNSSWDLLNKNATLGSLFYLSNQVCGDIQF